MSNSSPVLPDFGIGGSRVRPVKSSVAPSPPAEEADTDRSAPMNAPEPTTSGPAVPLATRIGDVVLGDLIFIVAIAVIVVTFGASIARPLMDPNNQPPPVKPFTKTATQTPSP